MKRTFSVAINGLLIFVFYFMGPLNVSAQFKHPNGIAYFKPDTTLNPIQLKEVDSSEMLFALHANLKNPAIEAHQIIVQLRGKDSIQVLYILSDYPREYTRSIHEDLSNQYFSLSIDTLSINSKSKKFPYVFEFLDSSSKIEDFTQNYFFKIEH